MKQKDIGWAAGIFEGEGWCGDGPRKSGTSVVIGQKRRWILDRLTNLFGGNVYSYWGRANGKGPWRKYWRWSAYGDRARKFLKLIYSELSPHRQKQVRKALSNFAGPVDFSQRK